MATSSVFDVTKGKSHYGVGGAYSHFAGRSLLFFPSFFPHKNNQIINDWMKTRNDPHV